MNIKNKIFIRYAIIFVIILFMSLLVYFYVFKPKSNAVLVNFILPENTTLNVYEPFVAEEASGGNKILSTINKSGYYEFKKGITYTYLAQNQEIYQQTESLFVAQEGSVVDIKFNYSAEYLKNKLNDDIAAINNSIVNKYPEQMKEFTLKYGKLYKDGSWFAGKLVPTVNQDKRDVFQIVLHKENDEWKIITTPGVSLSKDVYPDIPGDILEELYIINRDENMDREATGQ